jgi:hypothetical protein
MKMLFAAMLIGTLHTALEDREIALDGIGMSFTPYIFTSRMNYGFIIGEVNKAIKEVRATAVPFTPSPTGRGLG